MSKQTVTVDSISSIRLYMLSVPAIFGFLLFAVEPDTLYWQLIMLGLIIGILLVVLRLTTSFNPEKQTIIWKWGFIFPFVSYRERTFKDVGQVFISSKNQKENIIMQGEMSAAQVNQTYYMLYIVLKGKDKNKNVKIITSENQELIERHGERVTKVLSFKEKPYGTSLIRHWCR